MTLPAKVCVPALNASQLMLRERLFQRLDASAHQACTWVCGPPGAGKTLLVASWLAQRKLRALWYRVDQGDADPAVLPYYLRLAAADIDVQLPKKLPALTPDRRGSLEAFAADFFSPLFDAAMQAAGPRRMRRGKPALVVVFDNIDQALGSPHFAALLAAAIECTAPPAIKLLLVGREAPVGAFARLRAHEQMAVLDWRQLQLTQAEALELLTLRRTGAAPWTAEQAAELHRWCDGWISGLVLASTAEVGEPREQLPSLARDTLFPYLAEAVFSRQSESARRLLLTTALLPLFTAQMAEALSGCADAADTLDRMVRGNLFTFVSSKPHGQSAQRRDAYEFHSLLREFLLARGHALLPPAQRQRLLLLAGELLAADGQCDAAAEAFAEAHAWPALAGLVLVEAAALAEAGRLQTLAGWLARLPPALVGDDPWLLYWGGQCKVPVDPEAGRAALVQAFSGFQRSGDVQGMYLAWCTIVETIAVEWSDFSALDWCIEQGDRLKREASLGPPDALLAGRFACGMLSATMWRQPHRAEAWRGDVWQAVFSGAHDGRRMMAGISLFHYCAVLVGDQRELDAVYAWLRPSATIDGLSPIEALAAKAMDAAYAWLRGHADAAVEHVHEGRAVRDRYGLRLLGSMLYCHEIYALATCGRVAEAMQAMQHSRVTELDERRKLDVAHANFQSSLIETQAGDLQAALASIQAANRAVAKTGGPHQWTHGAFAEAQIRHELGDTAAARALLAVGMGYQQGARCDILEYEALLCHALFAIDLGEDCSAPLRDALAIGARNDILNYIWFRPDMAAWLCAAALERGLETTYVHRLIEHRQLAPPYPLEAWPLPVKVYAADGDFRVLVRGDALQSARKSPEAPSRVLRGLVELARAVEPRRLNGKRLPQRPVDRSLLCQHLRPKANLVTTDDWLDQNIKRLRERLGVPDAVQSFGGKLAINPLRVWVDLFSGDKPLPSNHSWRSGR